MTDLCRLFMTGVGRAPTVVRYPDTVPIVAEKSQSDPLSPNEVTIRRLHGSSHDGKLFS